MSIARTETEPAYDPEFEDFPDKAILPDPPVDKLAVLSLVAGISGFFLPVVGPVTAVVTGHVARDEIRKSHGRLGGDALARTGMILGYIWIALTVLTVAAGLLLMFTMVRVDTRTERVYSPPAPSYSYDNHYEPRLIAPPAERPPTESTDGAWLRNRPLDPGRFRVETDGQAIEPKPRTRASVLFLRKGIASLQDSASQPDLPRIRLDRVSVPGIAPDVRFSWAVEQG